MQKLKIVLLTALLVFASQAMANNPALNSVMNKLKGSISYLDDATLQYLVRTHYQTMRLMDHNGSWTAPELESISEALLPSDLSINDAYDLLDRMAMHAEENPYLVDFFEAAAGQQFDTLFTQVDASGAQILPAVVAYAVLQENMTKAMYNDYQLIEVLMNIWVPTRQALGIEASLSTFHKLKLMSVEKPMNDYIQFHSTGEVPADYAKLDLPLNIFEAVAEDLSADRRDNAKAGVILGFHLPGEQPARFSDDGKAVLLTMEEPKAWADLYTIWNMAFVSHFEYFPFVMVKLLIPQVNNISAAPEAYIYNRSLALYTHLHFSFLGQFDQLVAGQTPMNWFDAELNAIFGSVAKRSALKYEAKVRLNQWRNR